MLWYIIDGWNLINKVPPIKTSPSPRRELITFIKKNKLTGSKNNKVSIVFDGKMNIREYESEKEFEIIFSGERKADEVIISMVENHRNRKEIVVVSDDRQIIDFAKKEKANILKVTEFLRRGKRRVIKRGENPKPISYSLQREITEELRKIWLKNSDRLR